MLKMLSISIILITIIACDDFTTPTDGDNTINLDAPGDTALIEATKSSVDSDLEDAIFEMSDMTGDEEFYVVPIVLMNDGMTTESKDITLTFSGSRDGEDIFQNQESQEETLLKIEAHNSIQRLITIDNGWANNTVTLLELLKRSNKSYKKKNLQKSETTEDNYKFGDSDEFFLSWDGKSLQTVITAQVRETRTNSVLFLDSNDIPLDSNLLDEIDDNLIDIADKLENIIIPRLKTLIGEWTSEASIFSGLEADSIDNKISFVFSERLNSTGKHGLFNYQDLIAKDNLLNPYSNQQMVLFVPLPDEEFSIDKIISEIVSNMQKMINFIENTLWPYLSNQETTAIYEAAWLNDGLSCLISDLVGYGNYCYIKASTYLANIMTTPLTSGVSSDGQTGGVYLLLQYLFEKEGGATYSELSEEDIEGGGVNFVRALYGSGFRGIDNMKNALGSEDIEDIFLWFISTLLLDGTGLSSDYLFSGEVIDSFTENSRGISIRNSSRTIDTITYSIDGPEINSSMLATESLDIFPSTINVYTLTPLSGSFSYKFTADYGSGLYIVVVRSK